MTIHVNIADDDIRLSELVAAAKRGEEVILDEAGIPQFRLTPIMPVSDGSPEAIVARRMATLGIWKDLIPEEESIVPPSMTDKEWEERFERKFGPAA